MNLDGQRDLFDPVLTGRYVGANPTETERASGAAIEERERGELRAGGAGHQVLRVFVDGERLTAYDASLRAAGDFHSRRREATRLLDRGFLVKEGTLPNTAPLGRPHVDAYRITESGLEELRRLRDET